MTNLEWIRTLSAKELSDLLYDYWLPRGQYVWTDSRKGLIKVLSENYIERDCNKCKHQGNCYCIKGLGCSFEPKTDPQTDGYISGEDFLKIFDEPQTERVETMSCQECKHYEVGKPCKPFLNECDCHYEPQTERSK